jgi:fused signal recognition particle receptor
MNPFLILGVLIALGLTLLFAFRKKRPTEVKQAPVSPSQIEVKKPSLNLRKSISKWIPLLDSKSKDLAKWEEALIESDLGPKLTSELLKGLKDSTEDPLTYLKTRLFETLRDAEASNEPWKTNKPWVLFVLGVNGVGKTTTIVKLAHFLKSEGLSVGVVGADTFRKAASEQLERGVQKVGGEFFTVAGTESSEGADPSAVVFDGLRKFQDRDVILVDTSGRLHTKKNLMEELKKMKRVADKSLPGSPQDLWLVIDSTLGQNTVFQARAFHEAVGVTGMILTKIDGLGRGGTIFQLFQELRLPIRFLGVGEGISDIKSFKSSSFIEELFDPSSPSS